MSLATNIEIDDIYGSDGIKFNRMFRGLLDEVQAQAVWNEIENRTKIEKQLLIFIPKLEQLAFTSMTCARDNIPMTQDIIDKLRGLFLNIRDEIIDNDDFSWISQDDRERLETAQMKLAKSITILDIANDPGIDEVFRKRKTYAAD